VSVTPPISSPLEVLRTLLPNHLLGKRIASDRVVNWIFFVRQGIELDGWPRDVSTVVKQRKTVYQWSEMEVTL
jgi:hypothetical protein